MRTNEIQTRKLGILCLALIESVMEDGTEEVVI